MYIRCEYAAQLHANAKQKERTTTTTASTNRTHTCEAASHTWTQVACVCVHVCVRLHWHQQSMRCMCWMLWQIAMDKWEYGRNGGTRCSRIRICVCTVNRFVDRLQLNWSASVVYVCQFEFVSSELDRLTFGTVGRWLRWSPWINSLKRWKVGTAIQACGKFRPKNGWSSKWLCLRQHQFQAVQIPGPPHSRATNPRRSPSFMNEKWLAYFLLTCNTYPLTTHEWCFRSPRWNRRTAAHCHCSRLIIRWTLFVRQTAYIAAAMAYYVGDSLELHRF